MMKKIIITFITLFLSLTLFGCHSQVEVNTFEVPQEFDTSKNYEITFWAKNDSNVKQVNVYKKAIEDFEAYYPNIKVNLSLYTSYPDIYNDVITNIQTNTTPNVCITYPDHIATYITGNNIVVPLDELLTDEKYGLGGSEIKFDGVKYNEVVANYLDELIINDSYYAIPFLRSTEACYINEDMVKRLGYEIPEILTWDFVYEVSKKAMELKNEDGTYFVNNQNVLIPFMYKSTDNMMIQMLRQLDAPYSTDNGEIEIFNETTKEILYGIYDLTKVGAFSTFKISSYPGNFLNAGQCIFAIDSTAGASWMGSNAPLLDIPEETIVKFKTVVKPVPQYDTNNLKMISQGPSICVFNKDDSNEVLASWLFAQFLLTNDVQLNYCKTEGYVPVTSKCLESKEYKEYLDNSGIDNDEHYFVKIEASKILNDYYENSFTTPVFNGSASLRTAAGQLIEEVCKGTRRNKTINEEFMDNLFEEMNSLYRLDQVSINSKSANLSELPTESKALITSLVSIWLIIGAYFIIKKIKK